jgi:DNA-binding response OmpR family regulator
VVDDDRSLNTIVAMALEKAGYTVASADDGESGWDAICSNAFDLLITDFSMPKLNGLDLLRRMRANSVKLPAILMSADMPLEVGDIIELVSVGGAIHKPFKIKDLLVKVGTVLDNERSFTADPLSRKPKALGPSGRIQRAFLRHAAQTNLVGLARVLLLHESKEKKSGDNSPTIFRVFDKIRSPLLNVAGETGLRSILARALTLAKPEVGWLLPVKVSDSGSFEGLGLAEESITAAEISRGETAIIAQMLGLLFTFLGESMTRSLLQDARLGGMSMP